MGYFIYEHSVSGKDFVGRKQELAALTNLLSSGENVSIYEPPKTGRHSLLNQAFYNIKVTSSPFSVVTESLLAVRKVSDFVLKLGTGVLRTFCTTPLEYEQAVESYLHGTHFVFDGRAFEENGQALSLNWDIDGNDIRSVFMLPYYVASDRASRIYVVLDEFQNIMLTEDGDGVCKILSSIFRDTDSLMRNHVSFVFMGGGVNAMKDIFEVRKLFYRTVEHLVIEPMDENVVAEHFERGFVLGGKVIERDMILQACTLFRGNAWYLNYYFYLCDNLSKGFMTESVMMEALDAVIAVREAGFAATMNDLTTFQVNMLRAILDGHTKFSGGDVIHRYCLSSAANVHRLKEALCRKELITFTSDDTPVIMDPLFEYWLRKVYFEN